jgi:hypothetical protein
MYSGNDVTFLTSEGRHIDINSTNPIHIYAADSEYFRIVQGETQLYGVPEKPPLDYEYNEYFRLDDQLQGGKWEVVEGSDVSVELVGEESFTITSFCTSDHVVDTVFVVTLVGLIVWLLGIGFGWMMATD